MSDQLKPLGMRLAQKIQTRDNSDLEYLFKNMVYDAKEGINKIKSKNEWIPALLFNNILGTGTTTKASSENTDQDYDQNYSCKLPSTINKITKVKTKNTDINYFSASWLGTQTFTFVESENTDED